MVSKRLRVFLIAAVTVLLSVTVCVFASAEGKPTGGELKMRVHLFDAEEAYTEIQKLPGENGVEYALFLPSNCDRSNLQVSFDCEELVIGSETVRSGEATQAFAKDKTVKIKTDSGEFKVKVCSSENLPAVFINTESGSLDAIHADKNYKEKATLTLTDGGEVLVKSSALSHIKGRGSSSWTYNDKRSYNIKFAEKTEILGMPAAKRWAIVSNNRDKTLMRNAIVYTAAEMTDLPYTVDFRFADLYINGNYRGNYIICERIEVGKDRVNINDLENANEKANPDVDLDGTECVKEEVDGLLLKYWDLPNEPENVSGGYLLEYDRKIIFETEPSAFGSKNEAFLNIRSPEHVSQKEIKYLSALYDEFEEALFSENGKNSKGKSFMDYIDAASFVDAAVLNEFTLERDGGGRSWYIFLPEGSDKFYAGPAWDFDASMDFVKTAPDSVRLAAEELANGEISDEEWKGNALMHLLLKREFADLVAERTLELCDVFKGQLNARVNEMFDTISASAGCDSLRWNYEVKDDIDTQLPTYILKRTKILKKYFSDFDAAVEAEAKRIKEGNTDSGEGSGFVNGKLTVITVASSVTAAAMIACVLVIRKRKRRGK